MDFAAIKAGDEISFDDSILVGITLKDFVRKSELQGFSPIPNGNSRTYTFYPSDQVDQEDEEWVPILVTYGHTVQVAREGFILRPTLDRLIQDEKSGWEWEVDIILLGEFPEKDRELPVRCLEIIRTGIVIPLDEKFHGA